MRTTACRSCDSKIPPFPWKPMKLRWKGWRLRKPSWFEIIGESYLRSPRTQSSSLEAEDLGTLMKGALEGSQNKVSSCEDTAPYVLTFLDVKFQLVSLAKVSLNPCPQISFWISFITPFSPMWIVCLTIEHTSFHLFPFAPFRAHCPYLSEHSCLGFTHGQLSRGDATGGPTSKRPLHLRQLALREARNWFNWHLNQQLRNESTLCVCSLWKPAIHTSLSQKQQVDTTYWYK